MKLVSRQISLLKITKITNTYIPNITTKCFKWYKPNFYLITNSTYSYNKLKPNELRKPYL